LFDASPVALRFNKESRNAGDNREPKIKTAEISGAEESRAIFNAIWKLVLGGS